MWAFMCTCTHTHTHIPLIPTERRINKAKVGSLKRGLKWITLSKSDHEKRENIHEQYKQLKEDVTTSRTDVKRIRENYERFTGI